MRHFDGENRGEILQLKRTLYTIQDLWKGMLEYVLNKKDLLDAAQQKSASSIRTHSRLVAREKSERSWIPRCLGYNGWVVVGMRGM
jgi:hypothetical protein